jgi:hypothetical protein
VTVGAHHVALGDLSQHYAFIHLRLCHPDVEQLGCWVNMVEVHDVVRILDAAVCTRFIFVVTDKSAQTEPLSVSLGGVLGPIQLVVRSRVNPLAGLAPVHG